MKMNVLKTSWLIKAFFTAGFCYVLHKVAFFAGMGALRFHFSGVNGIAPLLYGMFGGWGASAFIFVGALARFLKSSISIPFASITMGIPTQGSLLVWALRENRWGSFLINVVVPLGAILFFVTRPEIGIGAIYSLFWLIPIGAHFMKDSFFKTAIQSTFVAHALGSCLWVSLVSMSPEQWIGLIPFVLIERLVYVGLQVLYVVCFVQKSVAANFIDKFWSIRLWYVNDSK
jgi:hypothetical protein